MTCCDPCNCIASVRVRQLVNADHTFDMLLDQQSSVRQQEEVWYFGANRNLRNYDCRWSGTATIDEDTRYEVRVWNASSQQPLMTVAPLDGNGRPVNLHVFSSLSDPHSSYGPPPPHQWSVDVIDEGSEAFRIGFCGQHLGYPVPLTLVSADHDAADINRDEKLELIEFPQPGKPMVYRLTKALDLTDEPLSLWLQTWSGSRSPLRISHDATADDIKYAIAPNQSLTLTLADGGSTADSSQLYASPDASSLSIELKTPAFSAVDLPHEETVRFSVYQADNDAFTSETLIYGDLLTVTGHADSGSSARSVSQSINPTQRYLRVKAVSSTGANLSEYEATIDLIGAQSLPPITPVCGRGVFDLYAYSETIGDTSLGPQVDWADWTVWLTFHEVETPPTRLRNEPLHRSYPRLDSEDLALFDVRGRIYVWPIDPPSGLFNHLYRLNDSQSPHLEPPWFVRDLTGGRMEPLWEGVWIDEAEDKLFGFQPYVGLTEDAVVLKLLMAGFGKEDHGLVWTEYRSEESPDLISGGEYTLQFAGVFCQAPDTDSTLPDMALIDAALADVQVNKAVDLAGNSLNLDTVTFRCLIDDFGRPASEPDPTWTTNYTLIANGWDGGDSENGTVTDLNGTHFLEGEDRQTLPNAPHHSYEWRSIAFKSIVLGVSYELINSTPFIPNQSEGQHKTDWHVDASRWNPGRQCLVAHVDGEHVYYRPKTRAAVSDDPDELVFEIDPNPPAINWSASGYVLPGGGSVSITSQPSEITIRVGPAVISSHCLECVENQQPTPMAFELTVPGITPADEPIKLLRRADTMWAAHVPGVRPHWLDDGDELLPNPLHDQLWILDGLETLRFYEVPVNGGDRRPIAMYRFRPIGHPQPRKQIDDPDAPKNESFLGWQKSSLDCVEERGLTLWQFGQGYDPKRQLLPSEVNLKPIGRECVYGSADYDWQHHLNRWESDTGNIEERYPDDFGLPKINVLRPDSEERTVCLGYDYRDAGIIWIDDIERWRVFATSCSQTELPSVPLDPDNGEPGEIRRIKCYTPDPPDPPVSPCRFISNDGVTWEQIDPSPDEACSEGHECREPWFAPRFVGDVANGYCEPVSCLGGESEWVWIQLSPTFGKWYWQADTCPDWCDALPPGGVGLHLQVAKGTCWCPTCT
jgi:hypothetical protein